MPNSASAPLDLIELLTLDLDLALKVVDDALQFLVGFWASLGVVSRQTAAPPPPLTWPLLAQAGHGLFILALQLLTVAFEHG